MHEKGQHRPTEVQKEYMHSNIELRTSNIEHEAVTALATATAEPAVVPDGTLMQPDRRHAPP
ncbi:MAG: hypothetical protein ACYCV0_19095 [Desulfitobacteriaceae bacterium]